MYRVTREVVDEDFYFSLAVKMVIDFRFYILLLNGFWLVFCASMNIFLLLMGFYFHFLTFSESNFVFFRVSER